MRGEERGARRSGKRRRRVGFVIDDQVPSLANTVRCRCPPLGMVRGWAAFSPMGEMRYGWIAEVVNADTAASLHYELYRPMRRYDALVFLKSMGPQAQAVARRARARGTRILFDLNVDYLTEASGTAYYDGMMPNVGQRAEALAMFAMADSVIADSEHLAAVASEHHSRVRWIPDNVNLSRRPVERARRGRVDGVTRLLWCGTAPKMVELLAAKSALLAVKNHVQLVVCTDDMSRIDRCFEPWRTELKDLLSQLDVVVERYAGIKALLKLYARGGVFIAPRHLDNSYNLGHTEWKIALPMSVGVFCLVAPLRSYQAVHERSGGRGLRICTDADAWASALDDVLSDRVDWTLEATEGELVIRTHYATRVVARDHLEWVQACLGQAEATERNHE